MSLPVNSAMTKHPLTINANFIMTRNQNETSQQHLFSSNFFFIRKINSKMNNFEFLVGHTGNEVKKANIEPKKK